MRVSENIAANSKLPAPERLAYFLLQLARIYEVQMGEAPPLPPHLTRQQIADNLGLTIETVSRSFTKLKNDNLIALVGGDTVVASSIRASSPRMAALQDSAPDSCLQPMAYDQIDHRANHATRGASTSAASTETV